MWLRYNHVVSLDMPQHCDQRGVQMTVEHALTYNKDGLVNISTMAWLMSGITCVAAHSRLNE